MELSAPSGWKLRATGPIVSLLVVLVGGFLVVAFMVRDHDVRTAEQYVAVNKSVATLRETVEEQTYVLTLDEKQRKDLRLDMPESLRRKTGGPAR